MNTISPPDVGVVANTTTDPTTLGSVCKILDWGTKIQKKVHKKFGLISHPRQAEVHPSLSGARSQPDLGSMCFSPQLDGKL